MRSIATFAAVLTTAVLAFVGPASACSCGFDPAAGKPLLLEKAERVVRGRVLQLNAFHNATAVSADVLATKTIKGPETDGPITIVTGFGLGDCGIPDLFLAAIAWKRELQLEIREVPSEEVRNHFPWWRPTQPIYSVHMCGYVHMATEKEQGQWDAGR